MYSVVRSSRFTRRGFPIQRSPDQRLLATSPELIAGCYVFRRLFTAKSSTVCPYVLQPSGCPNVSDPVMALQKHHQITLCIACKCCFYALHVSRLNRYTYLSRVVQKAYPRPPRKRGDTDRNGTRSMMGYRFCPARAKSRENESELDRRRPSSRNLERFLRGFSRKANRCSRGLSNS